MLDVLVKIMLVSGWFRSMLKLRKYQVKSSGRSIRPKPPNCCNGIPFWEKSARIASTSSLGKTIWLSRYSSERTCCSEYKLRMLLPKLKIDKKTRRESKKTWLPFPSDQPNLTNHQAETIRMMPAT